MLAPSLSCHRAVAGDEQRMGKCPHHGIMTRTYLKDEGQRLLSHSELIARLAGPAPNAMWILPAKSEGNIILRERLNCPTWN
jgi:hypothetical protein